MSMIATLVVIRSLVVVFCVTLALGSLTMLHAQGPIKAVPAPPFNCSEQTLGGRYAVRGSGWAPANPMDPASPFVPFANVGLFTFDGEGGVTSAATNSNNGNIFPGSGAGSYTLAESCRGTITLSTPAGILTFDLAVASRGTELYMISTNRSVVTVDGKRVQ